MTLFICDCYAIAFCSYCCCCCCCSCCLRSGLFLPPRCAIYWPVYMGVNLAYVCSSLSLYLDLLGKVTISPPLLPYIHILLIHTNKPIESGVCEYISPHTLHVYKVKHKWEKCPSITTMLRAYHPVDSGLSMHQRMLM